MSGFKLITTGQYSLEEQNAFNICLNKVENLILKCNSSLWKGYTLINDATYNTLIEYLEVLSKDSPILKESEGKVVNINTLSGKSLEYLLALTKNKESLQFILNPQGLGIKMWYSHGVLIKGITLGRSVGGIDITEKLKVILGERNDFLDSFEEVSVEGSLTIPLSHLDFVRDYCNIQDSYTGVFALLQDGVDEDALDLMHFICTNIYFDDNPFFNMADRYAYIESLGYLIPEYQEREFTEEVDLCKLIEDVIFTFDTEFSDYDYKVDGIRFVGDEQTIIMLKIGKWGNPSYRGLISDITWEDKHGKKIPVLQFVNPIRIDTDIEVSNMPLNSVNLLLILNLTIGDTMYFRYIGEIGILTVLRSGEFIIDKFLKF